MTDDGLNLDKPLQGEEMKARHLSKRGLVELLTDMRKYLMEDDLRALQLTVVKHNDDLYEAFGHYTHRANTVFIRKPN